MVQAIFSVYFCLLLVMPAQCGAAETFDRILAVVNDEIVTQTEFNRHLVLATLGANPQNEPDGDLKRKLFDQYVERKLLMQEARRLNITVKEPDVDKAMQDILTRNNMTSDDLRRQLEGAGLMIEDVRAELRAELTTTELIGREVHARVTVSDADMEKYYRENIQPKEGRGARVRLKQIMLKVDTDAAAEQVRALQERAESLRAQLEAGAAFEQLAASYSQCPSASRGGDLGFFYKNQLLPEIEQVAFSIPVGTVSPVIRSPLGFHIIVVTFRDLGDTEPGWRTYESDIRPILYAHAFEKLYTKWYSDLRAKAHIEVKF